jgi:hypothetical protein
VFHSSHFLFSLSPFPVAPSTAVSVGPGPLASFFFPFSSLVPHSTHLAIFFFHALHPSHPRFASYLNHSLTYPRPPVTLSTCPLRLPLSSTRALPRSTSHAPAHARYTFAKLSPQIYLRLYSLQALGLCLTDTLSHPGLLVAPSN